MTEEIPSSEETAAEEEDGGEPAAPAADSEEETSEPVPSASPDADSGDAVGKRPKRKVVEEFPDTPKPSDETFVDTLDYAALFKMFAEEPAAPQEEPLEPEEEAERPDGKTDAEEFEDWLASSGMSPEEVLAAIEAPRPQMTGNSLQHRKKRRLCLLNRAMKWTSGIFCASS